MPESHVLSGLENRNYLEFFDLDRNYIGITGALLWNYPARMLKFPGLNAGIPRLNASETASSLICMGMPLATDLISALTSVHASMIVLVCMAVLRPSRLARLASLGSLGGRPNIRPTPTKRNRENHREAHKSVNFKFEEKLSPV